MAGTGQSPPAQGRPDQTQQQGHVGAAQPVAGAEAAAGGGRDQSAEGHGDQPRAHGRRGPNRYTTLADGENDADPDAAVAAFTPCFPAGFDGLPEPLLPRLAEAAAPRAEGMLPQALVSTDPGLRSSVVDLWQRIVRATPADHLDRAGYLSDLGATLRARFEHTGDQADLDAAIAAGRAAVQATPADHPNRASPLSALGAALWARFERTGSQADLDAAVSAYTGAWEVVSGAPSFRIRAAMAVAELVAESAPGRAADMAEAAVWLLPEVTPRQLERGDQQHALGDFAGLAGDAAALALADPRGGQPERATRALRLLEAGRAVLLSQALDARSDLTDLNRQHPDLAARFVQLRDQLDQPAGTFDPADGSEDIDALAARQGRAVRDRHQLAREFAQTLAEIHALAGFGSFALPPTPGKLLAEANQGPVVVFNVSRYRSDALLLTQGGITHLELPQLTAAALTEQVDAFHRALHTATSGTDKTQRRQAQAVMVQVLQWLWDAAAGPVLDALGHHRQPSADADWPRVWWAPGGLLGLLPLHAAGYHTDPVDDPGRRTVMDRVISSHTPTVRALHHARQHAPVPDKPAQGLVVAMPTTPGLPDQGRLPHISSEVAKLNQHLPKLILLMEPDSSDDGALASSAHTPTKGNVLDHLPSCSIAHFACHGASHPTDPSKSQLLLHDHASDPLTVASLAPVRLDQAQLVYLSACRTAAIETADLIDEAIHLTSAFQLAGFPHVVGTLWEVDDQIAVTIADAFYTHLCTPTGALDTSRAAWACTRPCARYVTVTTCPADSTGLTSPSCGPPTSTPAPDRTAYRRLRARSASSWASFCSAPARLIWSPSISPSRPSRSAPAILSFKLSLTSAGRDRWAGSGGAWSIGRRLL